MITRNQAKKALDVAMLITQDSTPAVAMFNYSGHVDSLNINVYPFGWGFGEQRWYSFSFYSFGDKDEGACDIWNGEVLAYSKRKKHDTLEEMLTVIKGVATKGVEDGQTE